MSERGSGWGKDGNYALPRPTGKSGSRKKLLAVPVGEGASGDGSLLDGDRSGERGSLPGARKSLPGSGVVRKGDERSRGESSLPGAGASGDERSGGESPLPGAGVGVAKRGGGALPVPGGSEGQVTGGRGTGASEGLPLPGVGASSKGKGKGKGGRPKKGERAPGAVKPLVASVGVDDGWDEDNPAMVEADPGLDKNKASEFVKASRGVRITNRDIAILQFLARFRYAQSIQVARYVGSSKKSLDQRLTQLGKAGLLRREDVTRGQSLWTPTGWGLSIADSDFTAIGSGNISYVTIAHTLGLVNLGVELETGQENLLGEEEWPQFNRVNMLTGEVLAGETLVTEREIRQGQARWKKSGMSRAEQEQAFSLALSGWLSGDREGATPELEVGSEAMLILWATRAGRSDHIPDMVVARARNEDGTPGSHAIELELTPKPMKEWERILSSFYDAKDLYAKVHYFTHKKSIAEALEKVATEVGLVAEGRFAVHRYVTRSGNLPFWG